jgi:hypothetical protein
VKNADIVPSFYSVDYQAYLEWFASKQNDRPETVLKIKSVHKDAEKRNVPDGLKVVAYSEDIAEEKECKADI